MPDSGIALGADLYKMLHVAKDDLPSVAAVYGESVAKVQQAGAGVDAAMKRPAHFGGSTLGPVNTSWVALYGTLQRFLADTESSLLDTAQALSLAVNAYASTDAQAAAELTRLRTVNGEPHVGG